MRLSYLDIAFVVGKPSIVQYKTMSEKAQSRKQPEMNNGQFT